jgi:hypothetical protein
MKKFWLRLGVGCVGIPFGGIFLAVGLAIGLMFGKEHTFECVRLTPQTDEGTCELVSAGVRGDVEVQTLPISELQGARVASHYDSDDGTTTYRVELLTERGDIPLTEVWSSGQSGKQQNAQDIEQFVQDQSITTLTIAQDDRWFGYLFLGIFGGIGLLIMIAPMIAAIFMKIDTKS